jgi:hypothetical protein
MPTEWSISKESGKAKKPSFLLNLSKSWKVANEREGYYLKLVLADVPNPGREVNKLATRIVDYAQANQRYQFTVVGDGGQLGQTQSSQDINEQVQNLTTDPSSNWYTDSVVLFGKLDDGGRLCIEPEADGEQIGIYFFGTNKEDRYSDMREWIQHEIS